MKAFSKNALLNFAGGFHNQYLPFVIGLIIGLIIFPISITGFNLTYYPGDLGDARFNIYLLEHGYQFLSGKHDSYWNAPFMYPMRDVITLSDNLLGTVPLYSVFRVLGFDIFTAFQFWAIAIFALNFTAAYFLFKWLFKNSYAATIAAFIFAFSISLQSQMGHAQVYARFFIPLAFLFIFKFGKTFHPKYFFLAALCMIGQFYCGIYLGMLTLLPFITVALILVMWRYKLLFQSIKKIKWWILMLISIGLNAALLYKLMWPYYERSLISLPSSYESVFSSIPKIISYFFAKNGSLLWNSLETIEVGIPAPHWYNHQLFPGVFVNVSIIATCVILLKRKVKNRLELALVFIVGLVNLLFFVRVGDFSLYPYLYQIPGFHSLRSLTRIIGVDLLFFALSAGVLVNYLTKIFPNKKFPVFILILGFVVADNYVRPSSTYRSSKAIAHERVESLKEKMMHLSPRTVISYEPLELDNGVALQLDAMLAAQALSLICINGYSATSPQTFTPYWVEPNAENRRFWLNSQGISPDLPVVIN